ncbi:hypothetical protein TNCV_4921151 [Trichonephila clavipes]|nr:hypothetical protein TNCV_4921151 [Trichonephila clavipes]
MTSDDDEEPSYKFLARENSVAVEAELSWSQQCWYLSSREAEVLALKLHHVEESVEAESPRVGVMRNYPRHLTFAHNYVIRSQMPSKRDSDVQSVLQIQIKDSFYVINYYVAKPLFTHREME